MKFLQGMLALATLAAVLCGCLTVGLPSWLVWSFGETLRGDGLGMYADALDAWLLGVPQPTGSDGELGDTNPGTPGAPITLPGQPGTCEGGVAGPVGGLNWHWPADTLHLGNGWRFNPVNHPGIDIGVGLGSPIYAAESGIVVFSGWDNRGYGEAVVIDHGNGWRTRYGHLSQINVECEQVVGRGELIALSGSTGNSTGPHLHYEMSGPAGRIDPCAEIYLGACSGGVDKPH